MAGKNNPFDKSFAVYKPIAQVEVKKLTPEERKAQKALVINLRDFILGEYPKPEKVEGATPTSSYFRCTIKDMGLHPFEIDIYDVRILLIEVLDKQVKDADGNMVPFRRFVSRHYSINTALDAIATITAKRKLNKMDSSVITMRDYHDAYYGIQKYLAKVIAPEYAKALDKLQAALPFTQISVNEDDEEEWFKK